MHKEVKHQYGFYSRHESLEVGRGVKQSNVPHSISGSRLMFPPLMRVVPKMDSCIRKKIRTVDGITLEWAYPTTTELKAILAAFSAEYISITYLSPTAGDFVTKTFYVGDRSSPMYNSTLNRWENVSFKIVER